MHVPEGIAPEPVTAWLAERVDRLDEPLTFTVIPGGRSNLTFHVEDAGGRHWVLRRPPLHGVLESAHDVGREHRIMSALTGSAVPVPPLVGFEADPTITGAPFYVMAFVDGVVLRDADTVAEALDEASRVTAADNLVDTLVALHDVDPAAVGLGDLSRTTGYLDRQLRRWQRQYEQGRSREIPLIDEVQQRLLADLPEQGPAAIVHGDYRLDNLILGPTGDVRAVLDWELCTLGDPLADVGMLMVYWSEPGDETIPLLSAPTTATGFPKRSEVAARYAAGSGRDLGELDVYVAFGYWKVAVILEGVYARFSAGAYGETDESYRSFGDVVIALAERAAEAATRAGR